MTDFTDEELMAYADGELEPVRAEAVRAAVAASPDLAARVEVFARTRRLAKEAGLAALDTQVPPALMMNVEQMIARASGPKPEAGATQNVVPFAGTQRAHGNDNRERWMATAIAAGMAAIVAGAAGYWGGLSRGGEATGVVMAGAVNAPLAAVLSRLPSGGAETLGDGTRVAIVASFEDAGRTLCRDFEISAPSSDRFHAVACWRNGGWSTELALRTADEAAQYVPASGAETIDAFLGAIGADVALEPEQEKRLLEALPR